MKDSDRYAKVVEWSEADDCYVGSCPRFLYGGYHGDDQKVVFEELCQIVDETSFINRVGEGCQWRRLSWTWSGRLGVFLRMNKVRFSYYAFAEIGLLLSTRDEVARTIEVCEEACDYLNKEHLQDRYINCIELTSHFERDCKEIEKFSALWKEDVIVPPSALLIFAAEFEVDLDEVIIQRDDGSKESDGRYREPMARHYARDLLSAHVGDTVLAANIASPGSLAVSRLSIFAEGEAKEAFSGLMHDLNEGVSLAEKFEWPPLKKLDFSTVWKWLERTTNPPLSRSIRITRALSCATHLIMSPNSLNKGPFELAWAMAGLEAIYGKGNVGLKSQLLEKSEALLGVRVKHKKKFSWMYDFRSRVFHGDVDYSPAYSSRFINCGDDTEVHASECLDISSILLFSTLQHLCSESSVDLEFEYMPIVS